MLDAPLRPIHILLTLHPDGVGVNYSEHGEAPLLNSEGEPSAKRVKIKKSGTNKGKEIAHHTSFFQSAKKPSEQI